MKQQYTVIATRSEQQYKQHNVTQPETNETTIHRDCNKKQTTIQTTQHDKTRNKRNNNTP